mmetsp:Transcript_9865/g.14842  ORF Transcript_9865/g.14842 Transcript_9865/m.14842 type:complete len:315 (+) Transcript_9865:87-1031(+)
MARMILFLLLLHKADSSASERSRNFDASTGRRYSLASGRSPPTRSRYATSISRRNTAQQEASDDDELRAPDSIAQRISGRRDTGVTARLDAFQRSHLNTGRRRRPPRRRKSNMFEIQRGSDSEEVERMRPHIQGETRNYGFGYKGVQRETFRERLRKRLIWERERIRGAMNTDSDSKDFKDRPIPEDPTMKTFKRKEEPSLFEKLESSQNEIGNEKGQALTGHYNLQKEEKEKPFTCSMDGMKFSTASELSLHMKNVYGKTISLADVRGEKINSIHEEADYAMDDAPIEGFATKVTQENNERDYNKKRKKHRKR